MRIYFNRALRVLLVTNALILLAAGMLGPIYALFVDQIGGDLMDASIAGAIFAFAAGIITFFSGRFSDQIKENELIIVLGYTLMGIGFLLYLIVDSIYFLFAIQALIGIGEAVYAPAFDSIYCKHLNMKNSGTQWGAWESMYYFTTAVGAIIGGLIASCCGFATLFIIMALLCFLSSCYIYCLPRRVL